MKKLMLISLILISCASKNIELNYSVEITEKKIRPVPERFIGLSFEKSILNQKSFSQKSDPVLKNLIKQIGPGILRFGGNAVDRHAWDKSKSTCIKNRSTVDHNSIQPMFQFAHELNWKVLYGLNLGCGSREQAAQEVKAVIESDNHDLLAFQIGNEPNLYQVNGIRSKNWSVQDFISEFNDFQNFIQLKFPHAPISGPAFASLHTAYDKWFHPFLNSSSNLTLITQHTYSLVPDKMLTSPQRAVTIENLLSYSNQLKTFELAKKFVKETEAKGYKLRISETNSAAGGGKHGVSDVFTSSLWAVQHLLTLLDAGVDGVDFHGDPEPDKSQNYYSPIKRINNQYEAQPEYYGILFFKMMAAGDQIEVRSNESNMPIYAFKNQDKINVLILNFTDKKQSLHVKLPKTTHQVKTFELLGSDVTRDENITISGDKIDQNGLFNSEITPLVSHDQALEVELQIKPLSAHGAVFE